MADITGNVTRALVVNPDGVKALSLDFEAMIATVNYERTLDFEIATRTASGAFAFSSLASKAKIKTLIKNLIRANEGL